MFERLLCVEAVQRSLQRRSFVHCESSSLLLLEFCDDFVSNVDSVDVVVMKFLSWQSWRWQFYD